MRCFRCLFLWLTCVAALPCGANDPDPPVADPHPDLTRLSPREEVWIDAVRKEVIVGGRIAIDRGPIEFLACPEGTKEHESIVATRASARLVHAALLAIGLEPGSPVSFDPAYVAATGPRVLVRVRWTKPDGSRDTADVRSWVRNVQTGEPLDADWVFAGSSFWTDPAEGKEYYQADGGDLICVSNFPTATLDLPVESSQSNDALVFEAFEGRVPPRDTAVELILSGR